MESLWKYRQQFFIFGFLLVHCANAFEVRGGIKFKDGEKPATLPAGSWLVVKLEDVSLADAPSKLISTFEKEIKDYPAKPLTYRMSNEMKLEIEDRTITVSAVINVGWKADGDNRIRRGDYLTDTQVRLSNNDRCNDDSYEKDVPVIHYK